MSFKNWWKNEGRNLGVTKVIAKTIWKAAQDAKPVTGCKNDHGCFLPGSPLPHSNAMSEMEELCNGGQSDYDRGKADGIAQMIEEDICRMNKKRLDEMVNPHRPVWQRH